MDATASSSTTEDVAAASKKQRQTVYLNVEALLKHIRGVEVKRTVPKKPKEVIDGAMVRETVIKSLACGGKTLPQVDDWVCETLDMYGEQLMQFPFQIEGEEELYSFALLRNHKVDQFVRERYPEAEPDDRRLVIRNICVIVSAAFVYAIDGLKTAVTIAPEDVVPFLEFYSEFTLKPMKLGELSKAQRVSTYKLHTKVAAATDPQQAAAAAPAAPAAAKKKKPAASKPVATAAASKPVATAAASKPAAKKAKTPAPAPAPETEPAAEDKNPRPAKKQKSTPSATAAAAVKATKKRPPKPEDGDDGDDDFSGAAAAADESSGYDE